MWFSILKKKEIYETVVNFLRNTKRDKVSKTKNKTIVTRKTKALIKCWHSKSNAITFLKNAYKSFKALSVL